MSASSLTENPMESALKFGLWMPCAIVLSFALVMVLQSARGSSVAKDATRVTGVGGFFFKSENPGKLADWYRAHLGIALVAAGKGEHAPQYHSFRWREKDHPETIGATAFSIFPANTKYLGPGSASFMINYPNGIQFDRNLPGSNALPTTFYLDNI
jgi:hypothetical protein